MRRLFIPCFVLIAMAAPASAQLALPGADRLGLPPIGGVPVVGDVLEPVVENVQQDTAQIRRRVERLARERLVRIDRLLRDNPDTIERDAAGDPARKGVVLLTGASASSLAAAQAAGFVITGEEAIEGLNLSVKRLAVPDGMTLAQAQKELTDILPDDEIAPDTLYFQSGSSAASLVRVAGNSEGAVPIGMIDGGAGQDIGVATQRGFASGAPVASNHGSAVASLMLGNGAVRVQLADVYGTDPAGGNALAIARALGWLVKEGNRVISISLVGPANPLLARSIAAAQGRGAVIVAAVGNDGPASPPSYPASYNDVVAVTAVDRRNRALIEAGRALHLDYAAPGADIAALDKRGRKQKLRGTSYATPLVAVRVAAALDRSADWRSTLSKEVEDLGPKGRDDRYGEGLICGTCAGR